MQDMELVTDRTLRELVNPGTRQFPFQYYDEDMSLFRDKKITPHWHTAFEFLTVHNGTVFFDIGSRRFSLSDGEGIFINAGVIHAMECPYKGLIPNFLFSGRLIAPENSAIYDKYVGCFFQSSLSYLTLSPNIGWQADMLTIMQSLYGLGADTAAMDELEIHIQVCQLWKILFEHQNEIPRGSQPEVSTRSRARFHQMLRYIETHYAEKITLADIAASASISKTEANRCFQMNMHASPLNALNDYRLSLARDLLLSTQDSIIDIALMTGFDNYSYFHRMFKRKYDMTPRQLRKME